MNRYIRFTFAALFLLFGFSQGTMVAAHDVHELTLRYLAPVGEGDNFHCTAHLQPYMGSDKVPYLEKYGKKFPLTRKIAFDIHHNKQTLLFTDQYPWAVIVDDMYQLSLHGKYPPEALHFPLYIDVTLECGGESHNHPIEPSKLKLLAELKVRSRTKMLPKGFNVQYFHFDSQEQPLENPISSKIGLVLKGGENNLKFHFITKRLL